MEKYKQNIIKQFQDATNTKFNDEYSRFFADDFMEWFKDRKDLDKQYLEFLNYLGFDFNNYNVAEVGKSGIDSIVKGFDTTIITSYPDSFRDVDKSRIIEGKLKISGGFPYLVGQGENAGRIVSIPKKIVGTYITHNPYSQSDITGWEMLPNSDENDIIVGVYGKNSDYDKYSKIDNLRKLRDRLNDCRNVTDEYVTESDGYYYVVGSRNVRKRSRVIK